MHNHDGVLGYSQQQLNGRYPSHCGPTTPIGSTATVAENRESTIRQVSEWSGRWNVHGCTRLTGRSWPIADDISMACGRPLWPNSRLIA
jgi:hypothetical protein